MADEPTASIIDLVDGDKGRAMAFAGYKRKQLGAGEVSADAVRALIAYGDSKLAGEATSAPAAPKLAKIPRVREAGSRPVAGAPQTGERHVPFKSPGRAVAPIVAAAEWTEIKPALGSPLDYDVRYSGATTKVNRLGFTRASTERFGEMGFAVGGYVRIHWNAKARQLALTLSTTGFKMRNSGKDALSIAGKALVDVLGQDAIEFEQLDPVKGFDLVLGERGGES